MVFEARTENAPTFSIVIPAYNAMPYIKDCLDSAVQQSYPAYDIIVLDDGSTDLTGAHCDAFASSHDNMRVIHESNKGPLLARRSAVRNAEGEYIVFLDADDTLDSEALSDCAKAIRLHDSDIVCFEMRKGIEVLSDGRSGEGPRSVNCDYDGFRQSILRSDSNGLCGKAMRRSLFDLDVDYTPYSGMRHGEDLFQLLPIVDEAKSACYLDATLYFYRMNDAQGTARFREAQIADLELVFERLHQYGQSWNAAEDAYIGTLVNLRYLLGIVRGSLSHYEERKKAYEAIARALSSSRFYAEPTNYKVGKQFQLLCYVLEHHRWLLVDLLATRYAKKNDEH